MTIKGDFVVQSTFTLGNLFNALGSIFLGGDLTVFSSLQQAKSTYFTHLMGT